MKQGRPKEYKVRSIFTTSLEGELINKFREVCEREKKPMNEIVARFMESYIKAHGDGNPIYSLTKWVEDPFLKAFPTPWGDDVENWLGKIFEYPDEQKIEMYRKMLKRIEGMRQRGYVH